MIVLAATPKALDLPLDLHRKGRNIRNINVEFHFRNHLLLAKKKPQVKSWVYASAPGLTMNLSPIWQRRR